MKFSFLRKEISNKNVSVKELVDDFFKRIEKIDSKINSYNCLAREIAEVQAQRIDKLIQKDEPLPLLAGIPMAIKDNICTEGVVT